MTISSFKFSKAKLAALIHANKPITVKDTVLSGLKFKVGPKRSVFQFEKRISGRIGSPVTLTIGAFPAISVKEARQKAHEWANLCEKGIDPRRPKQDPGTLPVITLQTALLRFFKLKRGLGKKTLRKYSDVVANQIPKEWRDRNLNQLTADLLVEQFHLIRETKKEMCWEFLTVFGNVWNTCAPLYRDRAGKRLLGVNPVPEARQILKAVSRHQPKRVVIPARLLGRFVVVVERLRSGRLLRGANQNRKHVAVSVVRMCEIVLLSLFTGFRFGETLGLRWAYVDLENGIIRLPGVASEKNGVFEGTKNHDDHVLPLCSYAWDLLRDIDQKKNPLSPFVFPSVARHDAVITRSGAVFKRISESIEAPFSPHATRRTFASIAHEIGLGFLTVKRMLNHRFQGGVTGGYVVKGFNPEKERANFQKVCDFILDRKAEYLGQPKQETTNKQAQWRALKRFAATLGLDPGQIAHLEERELV